MNDKKFIYSTLMTIRLFENEKDIESSMKEINDFCCNYYHIKKGYKDKLGFWIENPDYTLLKIWISEKTGWQKSKKGWERTYSYKAYEKFDLEKEVDNDCKK